MRFDAAGVVHGLLKGLAIGFVEHAMGASKDFGSIFLGARRETMDMASDFNLLAQRQVLDTPDDGFDDRHSEAK
jgi:hypothetical protein